MSFVSRTFGCLHRLFNQYSRYHGKFFNIRIKEVYSEFKTNPEATFRKKQNTKNLFFISHYLFQHYELIVLEALQWDLSAVTPYSILDQILRSVPLEVDSTNPSNVRKHAETFVALAATEYHFTHKSPALIAVASLGSALRGLNPNGLEAMLTALQYQCGVQRVSLF